MRKLFVSITLAVVIGGFWFYRLERKASVIKIDQLPVAQQYKDFRTAVLPVGDKVATTNTDGQPGLIKLDNTASSSAVKAEEERSAGQINLAVPFISQAPTANWSDPFQNACEEASIIMVDYYYQNKNFPSPPEVEKILMNMVQWQQENWGGHDNLPIATVAQFVRDNYFYKTEIIDELNADKIRYYLDQGLPVIIPADGHQLDNPYFKNGGPDYHMLVVKGYVGDKFITNDPGTRRGADFIYTAENLLSSIHDWDSIQNKAVGPASGLVLHQL